MKDKLFLFTMLIPFNFLTAELAPDQIQNLEEQKKAYGEIPEREIKYYEETAPQNADKQRNFYMHDHPLQEDSVPDDTVK
ncbi:hypothetical protein [Waddlia chondrophila]|nr:hypothetical protein [Waddlia chondrophila]